MARVEALTGSAPGPAANEQKPFELLPTFILSAVVFVVFIVLQSLAALAFIYVTSPDSLSDPELVATLMSSGSVLTAQLIAANPLSVALILFICYLKKGISVKKYLGLSLPNKTKSIITWVAIIIGVIILLDVTSFILGREIVPPFVTDTLASASTAQLILAMVIMAPLFEEIFFRGFLFRGIEASKLGPYGALVITTLAFTVVHIQYDSYYLAQVLVLGTVLGVARLITRSVVLAIILHSVANTIPFIEVWLLSP